MHTLFLNTHILNPLNDILCCYIQVLKEFVCTCCKKADFHFPSLRCYICTVFTQYFHEIHRQLCRNYTVIPELTKKHPNRHFFGSRLEYVPLFFCQLNPDVLALCGDSLQ